MIVSRTSSSQAARLRQTRGGFALVHRVQTNQVEHDFLQEGEFLRGVVVAYGAGIRAKADVEHPVKSVLDAPIASYGCGELFRSQATRAEVIGPLESRLLIADRAQRVDQNNRLALGPIVQGNGSWRGQRRGNLAKDGTTRLAGSVVTVNRFPLIVVNDISLGSLHERLLIAFDRQQVVTALFGDLTGEVHLAPHDVDGDQQALDMQRLERFRDACRLISLAGDLILAENDAQFRREGTDQVNRPLTGTVRPTHRLAIDRNAAFQGVNHLGYPVAKGRLKLFRVQRPEDPQKRLLGGDAVLEHQEPTSILSDSFLHHRLGSCAERCSVTILQSLHGAVNGDTSSKTRRAYLRWFGRYWRPSSPSSRHIFAAFRAARAPGRTRRASICMVCSRVHAAMWNVWPRAASSNCITC